MTGGRDSFAGRKSSLLSATDIGDAVRKAGDLLAGVGCETARLDARVLGEHAFDKSREELLLHAGQPAGADGLEKLSTYCARRLAGEPVARILGRKEFWSLEFDLNDATLVPRPETELCVEVGLELLRGSDRPAPRILDLGTGSGCILISLLAEMPNATGVGIDVARSAVEMARRNAAKLGVAGRAKFEHRSWDDASDWQPEFDLVVANPPYIPAGDIPGLMPEVRDHDPVPALAGGEDGLVAYRCIAEIVSGWLPPGGFLVVEIGDGQAKIVADLFLAAGLSLAPDWQRYDLAGKVRVVVAKKR